MEMVLFVGIQATGKPSFYLERFFRTHVRINLDMHIPKASINCSPFGWMEKAASRWRK